MPRSHLQKMVTRWSLRQRAQGRMAQQAKFFTRVAELDELKRQAPPQRRQHGRQQLTNSLHVSAGMPSLALTLCTSTWSGRCGLAPVSLR
jgi:hypothetical protein